MAIPDSHVQPHLPPAPESGRAHQIKEGIIRGELKEKQLAEDAVTYEKDVDIQHDCAVPAICAAVDRTASVKDQSSVEHQGSTDYTFPWESSAVEINQLLDAQVEEHIDLREELDTLKKQFLEYKIEKQLEKDHFHDQQKLELHERLQNIIERHAKEILEKDIKIRNQDEERNLLEKEITNLKADIAVLKVETDTLKDDKERLQHDLAVATDTNNNLNSNYTNLWQMYQASSMTLNELAQRKQAVCDMINKYTHKSVTFSEQFCKDNRWTTTKAGYARPMKLNDLAIGDKR
ncbi:hypothetical protein HK097_010012 [Rhizophlyctis rosea]|uniref:Uncharacterized protein n=1 Tax=Rhizophlyctis rosea TaxID=64517 RepID=A0AAD5SID2_9FUNG|nr:hypothetical protein HK097_010012 [Rhizophlyctis rosea]